jgi:hypothetical protein
LIFQERSHRHMAFPEWQKSKPAWNEHTGVPDRYRTAEPNPDTQHNHRKTRHSRKPEETPTPEPKAQQSARLCSPCCSCHRYPFCSLLCCRRSQFAPSCAAAAPNLLPLALPPLLICSLLRCRCSQFAPSCAAAAPNLLPLVLPPLPICSLLHCRHRSGFASSLALHLATAHLRRPLGVCIERCLLIRDPSIAVTPETTLSVLCCSVRAAAARLPCALYRQSRVVFGPTTDGLGVGGICRAIRQTTTMAAQTVLVCHGYDIKGPDQGTSENW